jgi:hypothetical protein
MLINWIMQQFLIILQIKKQILYQKPSIQRQIILTTLMLFDHEFIRLLAKPASGSKMQEDLGAQELSVLDIHDAQGYKSTQQVAAEVGLCKKSIIFLLLLLSSNAQKVLYYLNTLFANRTFSIYNPYFSGWRKLLKRYVY